MSVLAGVRVVELGGIGPGPFCGMLLGDMGADVVVIDRRSPGDGDWQADYLNRNKRSVTIDLKTPAGVETARSLIDRADMLIDPFRPGVAERLGIGPEECLQRNPRLVYGRVTGWGQEGPLAQSAGHDLNYIAITGALDSIGTPDAPLPPLNLVGDYGGGALYLAMGLLAAHTHALRTGCGQVVDAAMCDGAASLMTGTYSYLREGRWGTERGTNFLDGSAPDYAVYRCADGRFIAISPMEDRFYRDLLSRLGSAAADLPERSHANREALRKGLERIFIERTRDKWCALLEGTECCFAPVLSMEEAPDHPHLVARRTFVREGDHVQPAPAPRFSRTPSGLTRPPPVPGADTEQLLVEWGLPDARAQGEAAG